MRADAGSYRCTRCGEIVEPVTDETDEQEKDAA
jgi:DNA-directed RNA polymerase subunit RPC12/RpoP